MNRLLVAGILGFAAAPAGAGAFDGSLVRTRYAQSFWAVNQKAACERCAQDTVDYKTEGLALAGVYGELHLWGARLFEASFERPLRSTDKQAQILRVNQSRTAGVETWAFGVDVRGLVERWWEPESRAGRVLRRLASLQYKQSRELFFAEATALRALTHLPKDASVDYGNLPFTGGTAIAAGDRLAFRSEFRSRELTFPLVEVSLLQKGVKNTAVRLGAFDAEWSRPADGSFNALGSNPFLYEATFESAGGLLAFETVDVAFPGLNFDLSLKWGFSNKVRSAVDFKRLFGEDAAVRSTRAELGVWYNHYLDAATRDGLRLSAGARLDLRQIEVHVEQSAVTSSPKTQDTDFVSRLFVEAGWRF